MKSTPAQAREFQPTRDAMVPNRPGTGPKMRAAKWRPIMTQATSQRRETEVWPRLATDPKATVSKTTAPKSGSRVQSRVGCIVKRRETRELTILGDFDSEFVSQMHDSSLGNSI